MIQYHATDSWIRRIEHTLEEMDSTMFTNTSVFQKSIEWIFDLAVIYTIWALQAAWQCKLNTTF